MPFATLLWQSSSVFALFISALASEDIRVVFIDKLLFLFWHPFLIGYRFWFEHARGLFWRGARDSIRKLFCAHPTFSRYPAIFRALSHSDLHLLATKLCYYARNFLRVAIPSSRLIEPVDFITHVEAVVARGISIICLR